MATGYKALLALGESHTKSVENTVQAALAQKKAKEQQRRKQQEEQERKQRELDTKMRLRYFEEQKKKAEAEARKEEELKAKEADLLRREAEQRDALRYGPKKAKAAAAAGRWPTSNSGVRDEVRRRRMPDEDDEIDTGSILTREEKRERKLQAELKRAFNAPRRPVGNATHRKSRGFPGGAVNIVDAPSSVAASGSGSVKERLAAIPNTLTRLNVVKRDTRTIDEIVRDRRENKEVLDGDKARTFDDWFTTSTRTKKVPARSQSDEPKKASTPIPSSSASSSSSRVSSQALPGSAPKRPQPSAPMPKPKYKMPTSAPTSTMKKRPRSPSMSRSNSPPPSKRPHIAANSSKSASSSKGKFTSSRSHSPRPAASSLSEEIWGLFGKNKSQYTARDVFSDSEDDDLMEADAGALEHEEHVSARIARKEEREAEAAERRHEEEKRRRKSAALAGSR
ncbi:member of major facilitator superfamily multidrug-dha1 sub-family [Favolaschia claudopus]|uniref:Member of major facilitator superfamily multidrug-dha1 sub-family n=1 Tax=Favolaschia claudopus TaxID=2862362 RepID=A0AAW0C1X4_9AGAR